MNWDRGGDWSREISCGGEGRKMQLHFSPSMRSITISNSNGGVGDLMKIKVASRQFSYRTLFHTILILAFLLPFIFILTALVTLEGVNKCSSFGTSLSF